MSLHGLLFLAYLVKTCASELAPQGPHMRAELPQEPSLHEETPALVPLGPVLREEPPAVVAVGAGGARLRCSASGDPAPRISWLAADGSPLQDEPGVRRVLGDGSLQVWRARDPQVLRCRAASARGAVLSRPITLQPVSEGGWQAEVDAGAAAAGGVAVLRCRVPGAGPVRGVTWYRAGAALDTADPRYLWAGDTLLIRDVSAADAAPYSCAARALHAEPAARSRPAPLAVHPGGGGGGAAPRLPAAAAEVSVASGDRFCLPCAAPDYPVPHYTWYREYEGRLQPVQVPDEAAGGDGLRAWAGGAALCGRASPELAGAWLCKAYNGFGDATLQLRLHVDADLNVTVTPAVVVAAAGGTAELTCRSSAPAALAWRHDGAPLPGAGARLVLRGVTRAHAGVYQCEATRGRSTALAAAELRLADSPPELQYTFIEQALRAGATAALRCAAAASPAPRIAWLLDGQPLDRFLPHHRYRVKEEASPLGEVSSLLNVSVSAADGGRYTCRAHNALGAVEHSARLNVYGPPAVRALGPVRAVAGDNVTLHCPYSGYPIRSIELGVVAARRSGGAGAGPRGGARRGAAAAAGSGAGRRPLHVRGDRAGRRHRRRGRRLASSQSSENISIYLLVGADGGQRGAGAVRRVRRRQAALLLLAEGRPPRARRLADRGEESERVLATDVPRADGAAQRRLHLPRRQPRRRRQLHRHAQRQSGAVVGDGTAGRGGAVGRAAAAGVRRARPPHPCRHVVQETRRRCGIDGTLGGDRRVVGRG